MFCLFFQTSYFLENWEKRASLKQSLVTSLHSCVSLLYTAFLWLRFTLCIIFLLYFTSECVFYQKSLRHSPMLKSHFSIIFSRKYFLLWELSVFFTKKSLLCLPVLDCHSSITLFQEKLQTLGFILQSWNKNAQWTVNLVTAHQNS